MDLSYTFGDIWSFTIGYSISMNGKGFIKGSKNYVTSKVSGDSYLAILGITFIGGELLSGFRNSNIEFGPFLKNENGSNLLRNNNVILRSKILLIGYGFHF